MSTRARCVLGGDGVILPPIAVVLALLYLAVSQTYTAIPFSQLVAAQDAIERLTKENADLRAALERSESVHSEWQYEHQRRVRRLCCHTAPVFLCPAVHDARSPCL